MKFQRLIVGIAASLSGLLFAASPAFAANSEEITISPASLKIEGQAGQTVTGTFKVVNTGNIEFRYKVYAAPYSVRDTIYSPDYSTEMKRNNINKNVSLNISEGTLKPREQQEVEYNIAVPTDAASGSHYSVIFAETIPDANSGMVVRTKRVGALARITVEGDRIEQGRTESIDLPWWTWTSKLKSDISLENTGNVDLDANTSMAVNSLFGRELHIEQRSNAVFPDYPRVITYEWGGKWRAGIYKVEVTSEIAGETTTESKFIILSPPWLVAVFAIFVLAGIMAYGIRQIRKASDK